MTKHYALWPLLVGVVLLLFLSRFPGWKTDGMLNIDEAMMMAGTMTMHARGLMPWRDFDVTTVGPVTIWFLSGATTLGMPLDYRSLHLLAAVCWTLTALMVLIVCWVANGMRGAAFSFIVLLCVSLSSWHPEFLHFSTETLPALLLCGAAFVATARMKANLPGAVSMALVFLAGVLCSLAVMAKMQCLPIAAFLCAAQVLPDVPRGKRQWGSSGLIVLTGAVFLPLVIVCWLATDGQVGLAAQAYLISGASYGSGSATGVDWLRTLARDLYNGWLVLRPFFPTIALAGGLLWLSGWLTKGRDIRMAVLLSGWFASALVAMLVPALRWPHHGVFLLAPATALFVYLVCELAGRLEKRAFKETGAPFSSSSRLSLGCPTVVMVGFMLLWLLIALPRMLSSLGWSQMPDKDFASLVMTEVLEVTKAETTSQDSIVVWGWAPEINVASQLPSATRHVVGLFLVDSIAGKDWHRATFMKDVKARPPTLIIDAVAPGFFMWSWRNAPQKSRISCFPEFAAFVEQRYEKIKEVRDRGSDSGAIIYRHRL